MQERAGLRRVRDNFEIYHLLVTRASHHAVNWTWLQLSLKLPFSHSRRASTPQHDDKISSSRSLECVSKLQDRVVRDVNVPKPIHDQSKSFDYFPTSLPLLLLPISKRCFKSEPQIFNTKPCHKSRVSQWPWP